MKRITAHLQKLILVLTIVIASSSCKQTNKEINKKETDKVNVSNQSLNRVEPPNWWIGFKDTTLQLLINEPNIGKATPSIQYAGVRIKKVHQADSPNYLFLDLEINATAAAGQFDIEFTFPNQVKKTHTYLLKERTQKPESFQGFTNADAIYLITPDRFANGNTTNDIVSTYAENIIDRNNDYKRHGGDLQGITQHLDYISNLGFTSIWLNPVLENNMEESSYHGYAITNYYEVDKRYGTLKDYQELAKKMKDSGLKLIMDQVANHCGYSHWWMQDLPFKDWLNYQDYYLQNKENWTNETYPSTNHRRTANQDLYASNYDKQVLEKGWFVPKMPDLNQQNPFMAKYIIQNSIWWIETLRLGGIRQDTYPYPNKDFMANWATTIMEEYPNFNIVGEEWSYNPLLIGYWQQGAKNKDGYQSNLKTTMDFAMQKNIVDGVNQEESWNSGFVKMYEGLANDFHYANPNSILLFPDNHDMSRIFTQCKGNVENTKMAIAYIAALPRTIQFYYGTEILMNDFKKPGDHGLVRSDFPGGWQEDTTNAFTGKGLTSTQKEMQEFIKKLLNYRKQSKAIQEGKTIHFAPKEGTYFLFRVYKNEIVAILLNKNEKPITIDLQPFKEVGLTGKTLKNLETGETILWNKTLILQKKGVQFLSTKTN